MMMLPRRNELDLFKDFFGGDDFFLRRNTDLMKTDIKEKENSYVIEMDLPGYEKENINLVLKDGYLEVSAKMESSESDESDRYIHKERFYGEASRSFYVGEDVEESDIKAEFKNGILRVDIPKMEEKKKLPEAKHIEIL